ncbi:MAG: N-6 DNA methylase [Methylocystis sp.]
MALAAPAGANSIESPSIANVGRFVADVYLSYAALEELFERGALPPRDHSDLALRHVRSLWNRVVDVTVTIRSERAASSSRLYGPILTALGYETGELRSIDVEIGHERVKTEAVRDDAGEPALLVEALPFGQQPDDRYSTGPFRGSAQRKMERMLAETQVPFGIVLGGASWRLVQLDTAGEPRYLEFDLDAIVANDDVDAWRIMFALLRPSGLIGPKCLTARLIERSDEHGTSVSEALGPATRRALEIFLEAVRSDEANAAWAPATFADPDGLRAIHEEGVYTLFRLLFVLYGEAMGLLPLERPLYREAYSIEHIRGGLTHAEDFVESSYALWDRLQALFQLIDRGVEARDLRIPSYNGGLFGLGKTPRLAIARVNDAAMAAMLRALTTVEVKVGKNRTQDRVSFRELGVGQLGAVFESLLDYEPAIASDDLFEVPIGTGKQKLISFLPASAIGEGVRRPAHAAVRLGTVYLRAWGGQRKSTGSYYTPQVIAEYLVREALAPQIPGKASSELLELSVCDPAMGSGGFLVAATKFLGDAYYETQITEGLLDPDDPLAADHRVAAWRTVAEHCIYGVDMNPMAVELAKVSLWLTTLAYDRPLSFFDHHLRCGNSLLGAPLRGHAGNLAGDRIAVIPRNALDDVDKESTVVEKTLLKRARERNTAELRALERGQLGLFGIDVVGPLHEYAKARAELTLDDPTQSARDAAERNHRKERMLQDLTHDPRSRFYRLKQICDLWMAAWFWPHDADVEPPSTGELRQAASDLWTQGQATSDRAGNLLRVSSAIAKNLRFFHWELEFPEVFECGGFNAFIGNPPWETLGTENKEFFSNYDPLYRSYAKQEAVARARLLRQSATVEYAYRSYNRRQFQLAAYLRKSGCYTWYAAGNLGKGDFDLFRSFVERDYLGLRLGGQLAQVLKDSIYLNANCTEIRRRLLSDGSITRLVVNENRKQVFPIDSRIKVALLTARRGELSTIVPTAFFVGKDSEHRERGLSLRELVPVLAEPERFTIPIGLDFIKRLAPQTFSFLEIVDRKDAALLDQLSRNGIPFAQAWEPQYYAELHASSDSDLFRYADWLAAHGCVRDGWNWTHPELGEFWPLVEGRNIYQFEFPVGDFDKWVNAREGIARLPRALDGSPVNLHPRLAWRDVARSTDERSVIAAIVPPKTFCKHKAPTVRGGTFTDSVLENMAALFNSLIFDWQARARGASGMTYTLLGQLFTPGPIEDLALVRGMRQDQEAAAFAAFDVPFELAEHACAQFSLLDRLMPPLPGEDRSTITRDLVLARYAEMLGHPFAAHYRERARAGQALGAVPFVPATRVAEEVDAGDMDDNDEEDS